jgi:hypothetical protein
MYDDHNLRVLLKQTRPEYDCDADITDDDQDDNIYFLSDETFENNVKLDWPPPFERPHYDLFVFGSAVNGILCLDRGSVSAFAPSVGGKVVLWIPSTGEFKVIPNGSIEQHKILQAFPPSTVLEEPPVIMTYVGIHGFGYDPVTDDYKLIRRFCCLSVDPQNYMSRNEIGNLWQIYSLKCNCWRDLQVEMPGNRSHTIGFAVNLYGMCHWLGGNEGTNGWNDELVSFNLRDETFIRTPLIHHDDGPFQIHLVVLRESIALIEMDTIGDDCCDYCYMISILGELGVAESLTRLFRIGPLPDIQEPIGVGKNGDIFYFNGQEEIAKYNLNTEMIEKIGFKGRYASCQVVIYNESLLPIGGILS